MKMLYKYVGSSKPDLISQRNTQMTNKSFYVVRSALLLCSALYSQFYNNFGGNK